MMPRSTARTSRNRHGFTLVELIVALALVDAALLALLGTSAFVMRELGIASTRTTAIAAAHARIERLASTSCGVAESGGSAPAPGLREWWTDTPASSATRVLVDSIELTTARGPAIIVLRGRRSC